jgi:type VI secretion system protein ImpM
MFEPPGWFGKMPALGDFASRRLPSEWIGVWDDWLQHEIVRARAALGDEGWLETYLVAPVRRFWLAAGLVTRDAWLGLMMPSVDSVGRHFPFTLAVPLPATQGELVDALAGSDWLDAADTLARQVLDPDFGVDALEQALAQMPLLHGERRLEAHAGTLLAEQLRTAQASMCCAWWCEGAREPDDFICADGLPSAALFDALLHDGR